MQRGLLNGSNTAVTNETFAQCWSLDPTSNWHGFREADTGGSWTTVQSRSANPVNEITNITNSTGSAWVTPEYDAAGNTTTIPQPADPTSSYTATYDAWNRMVQLIDTDTTDTVQQNAYDARTYRTVRKDYASGSLDETRHFFYSSGWQSLEERLGTSPDAADPERQQVWGKRYVDDLVLRDRDTDDNGSLDERLYGLQDANWNVVALTDTAGAAQERYQYSPFGTPSFLNGVMSVESPHSAADSSLLFTGQTFDSLTLLHLFRRRWFSSMIGQFIIRDTPEYPDGANLYAAWFAPDATDPYGTKARRIFQNPFKWKIPPFPSPKDLLDWIEQQKQQVDNLGVDFCKAECQAWIELENIRGNKWLSTLKSCPCAQSDLSITNGWVQVAIDALTHTGCKTCFRSIPKAVLIGAGQQCCFDDRGHLLTHGPGAGTADRSTPNNVLGHFVDDYYPYLVCKKAGMEAQYLTLRPNDPGEDVNTGLPCPKNPPDPPQKP